MRNGVMDKDVLRYLLGLAHLSCQGVIRFLEPRRVSVLWFYKDIDELEFHVKLLLNKIQNLLSFVTSTQITKHTKCIPNSLVSFSWKKQKLKDYKTKFYQHQTLISKFKYKVEEC